MKKIFNVAFVLLFIGSSVQAQLPDLNKASQEVTAMANPGKLLTQLTDAIKPASFLSSWSGQKSNWLGTASKITSAVSMVQSLSSLIGFLKPGAFKSGFNVQNLLQMAGTAKTMSDATGLLKNLEGGLKPESLSDTWVKQKTGWLSALSLVR